MTLTPRLRKTAFLAHVALSVGWLGAVAAYLALAWTGLRGRDPDAARSAYLSMELIGWSVIVPLSLASLVSGLIQSLGTEWGLFRHTWIAAKFFMASTGSVILLVHMRTVGQMAGFARSTGLSPGDFGDLRLSLMVHAVGGLLLLMTATALSVFKPWGAVTPRARRHFAILLGILGLLLLLLAVHHLAGPRHH